MNIRAGIALSALLGIGLLAGYFLALFLDEKRHQETGDQSKQIRQMGDYQFINPLLECEVAEGTIDARKENFKADLETFAAKMREERKSSYLAVMFRDLNNGPAFGVNESEDFSPASLLKVPVMMAYYRWSEAEPGILAARLAYEKPKEFNAVQTIIPRESLEVGQTYSVDELLQRMIKYSDNQALGLLTDSLPLEKMQDLFSILGVGGDVLTDPNGKISVREYAAFFRILFNSSYLSRENSEKALRLLSETDFNDALPASVPADVPVAHKFGEAGTEDIERQLHDCGIVYFPNHPYLACIMTRGQDPEKLKETIRETSSFIYNKIDEQY